MHRMLSKRSGVLRSSEVAIPKVVKSAKSSSLAPEEEKEKESETSADTKDLPRDWLLQPKLHRPTGPGWDSNMAEWMDDVGEPVFRRGGAEGIQARAPLKELEFQRAGSTIQAISDMHRSPSNGIKVTIGA